MSASRYTRRINIQTQARNGKVQYPGARAMYNPIWATCATNPDFSVLTYTDIPISCSTENSCIPVIVNPCLPRNNQILNGQFSTQTSGCMIDGGFSNSNYSIILNGGNSSL
jgi:hypothetical protein